MNMDRWEEAISDLDSIIKLEPENAEAFKNRGFAYMKLGDFNNAIPDFVMSLDYCLEEDLSSYHYLGLCYFNMGEYEKANENFEKFHFYFPNDVIANSYVKRCLRMLKIRNIKDHTEY
jgi:tetratricopeptide (TPR) repeat protein